MPIGIRYDRHYVARRSLMGTKPTAVVSCFGIIGIIIALLCGDKSNEARYYIRQSVNALISSVIVSAIVGFLCAFIGGNIFSTILNILSSLYGLIIFIEILVSAINLDKREVWGIFHFLK